MKKVEPQVYLIGKSEFNHDGIKDWLANLGADDYVPNRTNGPGAGLISMAAKRCYMSFQPFMNPNVKRVREDMEKYLDNILTVGHGSVLEHVTYNFALENVSRVFTAEMNRHRAGMAISEGSLRYIRFDDIPFWMPDLFTKSGTLRELLPQIAQENKNESSEEDKNRLAEETLFWRKEASIYIFKEIIEFIEEKYTKLVDLWGVDDIKTFHVKKLLTSAFRRIVPMGVATGGVWSGNIRALRHIFTMRCDPSAEEEIRIVCAKMLQIMIEQEPLLFKDFSFNQETEAWECIYKKV